MARQDVQANTRFTIGTRSFFSDVDVSTFIDDTTTGGAICEIGTNVDCGPVEVTTILGQNAFLNASVLDANGNPEVLKFLGVGYVPLVGFPTGNGLPWFHGQGEIGCPSGEEACVSLRQTASVSVYTPAADDQGFAGDYDVSVTTRVALSENGSPLRSAKP